MKCTTVLHGGVCHGTSTPHKNGNNMKKKKNVCKTVVNRLIHDNCVGSKMVPVVSMYTQIYRLSLDIV